ncbi:hypothetical protein WICPIJ_001661 [Wickerhamomyces pijperi]|uniref:Uncharacterized protein n=1 Tax=Wickerhamomyces pijperi TaxID=599730 RepID=A0A9P8QDD5_WICPI|nr:hypothetical protein WICPIJ_001661 [Wickerhamomyces pijperi]
METPLPQSIEPNQLNTNNISAVTSTFTDIYFANTDTEASSLPSSDLEYRREQDLISIYNEASQEEQEDAISMDGTEEVSKAVDGLELNEETSFETKNIEDTEGDDTLPYTPVTALETDEHKDDSEILKHSLIEEAEEDEEFGDFDQPEEIAAENLEDEDDDFGDFSDASFDDFEEPQVNAETLPSAIDVDTQRKSSDIQGPKITDEDLDNTELFHSKISQLLDLSFPDVKTIAEPLYANEQESILTETAAHLYERLTAKPYLQPIQWKKTETKRRLMALLKIPDETILFPRTKDLSDLESQLSVPEFKALGLSEERKKEIIEDTEEQLSKIEEYISKDLDTTNLTKLISKYEKNIANLTTTLACWEDQLKSVSADHETFESVIENMVGFTQRVTREEQGRSLKRKGTLRGIFGKYKGKDKK